MADDIAARALSHVGVPFRFKGRSGHGLDCVGLVADATGLAAPFDYDLRGDFWDRIERFLMDHGFARANGEPRSSDIVLVRPSPQQWHLMVAVDGGFVHAHAGLRRVVLTPAPSPWPVVATFRFRRN